MSSSELMERAAIGDLLDDYAYAVDSRDWDLLRSLFTADAVLDYSAAGGPKGSRDEVLDWISTALPAVTLSQHLITNRRIRVHGDTASVRSELLNPLLFAGDDGTQMLLLGGRYDDRVQRTPDGWKFTERVHTTTWTAGPVPAQLSGPEA
jgi:ketosteroid isomerase-like protein